MLLETTGPGLGPVRNLPAYSPGHLGRRASRGKYVLERHDPTGTVDVERRAQQGRTQPTSTPRAASCDRAAAAASCDRAAGVRIPARAIYAGAGASAAPARRLFVLCIVSVPVRVLFLARQNGLTIEAAQPLLVCHLFSSRLDALTREFVSSELGSM